MINLFNKCVSIWPLVIGAVLIFTATLVFAGVSRFNNDVTDMHPNSKDTCPVLETYQDTLDYVKENIDINGNGMPDDVEFGTDSIYQIILDNQQAIDEISIDLDRIHKKLDELTATR